MNHFPHKYFQLFEHETLHLGEQRNGHIFDEQALAQLLRINERQYPPYFRVIHRGIRATQWVGNICFPGFSLEVLPKTERQEAAHCRGLLLSMLEACGRIPACSMAQGFEQQQGLYDCFASRLSLQAELLLRKGLRPRYRSEIRNCYHFSGLMLLQEQVRKNYAHKERIVSRQQLLDEDHSLHHYIAAALHQAALFSRSPLVKERLARLLHHFPAVSNFSGPCPTLTKEEGAYTECLQWARWINENVRPAQRSGKQAGLAFMTDMPRLFEQYVSQSVSRAATAFGCRVELQARRPFWGSRSIRPDIILSRPDGRKIILDTKWKMLGSAEPEDADLKQMYIYHQFFEAEKGVLLYPAQAGLCPYGRNFHQNKKASLRCELRFVNLPDQSGNKLNSRLGEQILEEVLAE